MHFGSKLTRIVRAVAAFGLFGLMCLVALSANAADSIAKGNAAEWVELIDIPTADPKLTDRIKYGVSHLLSEYQIRHRPDGWEVFDRYVYKIVDRAGLDDGATVSIQFDPSTSDITMNRLNIVRDGVVLDRLPGAKFEIARRERDAEKGIFDGWLTAYVNIEDVRIGDVIEYAKTTVRRPSVGPDLMAHGFAVEWDSPIALLREKIVWPADQPLTIRNERTDLQPKTETRDGQTTYFWEVRNPAPVKIEDNIPADVSTYARIDISTASNWQQVVDAVLPHYKLDQELPTEFNAKLDDIASRWSKPEDRMIEAMRLVQDNIRYVSLSIGSGSYIPRKPATVISNGFGDCKDKSLLLATSLRRLGVQADIALTDLDEGLRLAVAPPSLRAFDHAIVKAVIGSEIYWIDATDFLQGGRADNLIAPSYDYALPIVASGAVMEKIERKLFFQPTTEVTERFDFPVLPGTPLTLTVTTIYREQDADRMRLRLINNSVSKLSDDYLSYYNRQYPGMRLSKPLQTEDDRDLNVFKAVETYSLAAADLQADDLIKDFPVRADFSLNELPQPSALERRTPIAIGRPVFFRHKIMVNNLKAAFAGPENFSELITPYMAFRIDWKNTPTTFTIDWFFNKLTDRVPAKDASSYLKSLDKMKDNASWTYDFSYDEATSN